MGKMKIHTNPDGADFDFSGGDLHVDLHPAHSDVFPCLLYTSDAADDMQCVDLGGRRIIKKKK